LSTHTCTCTSPHHPSAIVKQEACSPAIDVCWSVGRQGIDRLALLADEHRKRCKHHQAARHVIQRLRWCQPVAVDGIAHITADVDDGIVQHSTDALGCALGCIGHSAYERTPQVQPARSVAPAGIASKINVSIKLPRERRRHQRCICSLRRVPTISATWVVHSQSMPRGGKLVC